MRRTRYYYYYYKSNSSLLAQLDGRLNAMSYTAATPNMYYIYIKYEVKNVYYYNIILSCV